MFRKFEEGRGPLGPPWLRLWPETCSLILRKLAENLEQWFLTGEARLPREAQMNFQGCASPYALYKMGRFWTEKCFQLILKQGRLERKGQLLKGGVVDKRLRTFFKIFDDGRPKPELCFLPVVEVNALAQGAPRQFTQWPCIQPSNWEAETLPLNYCHPN